MNGGGLEMCCELDGTERWTGLRTYSGGGDVEGVFFGLHLHQPCGACRYAFDGAPEGAQLT